MTYTYKYEMANGHIIALAGQSRLLIDTGAPSSVADASPLAFAGAGHPAQKTYMEISPESLSKSVGSTINALVGTDILGQYDMRIDPETHTIDMSEDELPLSGQPLEVDDFMGIPVIEAKVNGSKVRMFFDTGAKLSYLDPDRTRTFQPNSTEEDFYPGFGSFRTDTFDIPITIGTETVMLRAGNLPEILQMTLMMANTGGILGSAILQTHKVVFAPRRKAMAIWRI